MYLVQYLNPLGQIVSAKMEHRPKTKAVDGYERFDFAQSQGPRIHAILSIPTPMEDCSVATLEDYFAKQAQGAEQPPQPQSELQPSPPPPPPPLDPQPSLPIDMPIPADITTQIGFYYYGRNEEHIVRSVVVDRVAVHYDFQLGLVMTARIIATDTFDSFILKRCDFHSYNFDDN